MTPFLKRNLLIPFSFILFAGLLYGLTRVVPALRDHVQHLELIALSLMIMVSLVIMFFWSSLGVIGGLLTFLVAMIYLYRPLTDLNPFYYSVLILAFFLSSFLGYHAFRKINTSNRDYTVTKEKVQEDTNLIREHLKGREAEVIAMGDKINSLLKLKGITDRLSTSLSGEEVMKIVTEETFDIFKGDHRVLLFMADGTAREMNLSCTAKDKKRKAPVMKKGGIFDRWVMKNMKSLLVKDKRKDFRFSVENEEMKDDFLSLISKPLVVESNVIGILRVDSPREAAFSQHELRILDIIGELAAVALENARLYCQTEELAIKDSLTGLYVHRYFMERLEEEVKRALLSKSRFAMLMLDIDDFKEFNDKHGHISGDIILRKIGKILNAKASAGDIVARYGGEEFAFLALDLNRKEAIKLAEDIRKDIQDNPVVLRRKKYSVTVSAGVAIFPDDARLKKDIIWESDKYLYEAKAKGKNKVCSKK